MITVPPASALIVGCGYLGRRVARLWQAAGTTIHALTRSPVRATEFAALGWRPIIGDLCDPDSLAALPAVDVTLSAVGYDRSSGKSQQAVYVDGLRSLLEVVRDRSPQFLYVSSSSVYGQQAGEWVDETSSCVPAQPGGRCCLAAEDLVREVYGSPGLRGHVLRLSGIYGPDRLLSRIEGLKRQEPLAGSPDAWLNLIHVDDAAAAVVACQTRGRAGECYLVSDDEPIRRGAYYAHLAELLGTPAPVFDEQTPAKRGAGGLNKRCRNDKLKRDLAVTLRYPNYRDGLRQALTVR